MYENTYVSQLGNAKYEIEIFHFGAVCETTLDKNENVNLLRSLSLFEGLKE